MPTGGDVIGRYLPFPSKAASDIRSRGWSTSPPPPEQAQGRSREEQGRGRFGHRGELDGERAGGRGGGGQPDREPFAFREFLAAHIKAARVGLRARGIQGGSILQLRAEGAAVAVVRDVFEFDRPVDIIRHQGVDVGKDELVQVQVVRAVSVHGEEQRAGGPEGSFDGLEACQGTGIHARLAERVLVVRLVLHHLVEGKRGRHLPRDIRVNGHRRLIQDPVRARQMRGVRIFHLPGDRQVGENAAGLARQGVDGVLRPEGRHGGKRRQGEDREGFHSGGWGVNLGLLADRPVPRPPLFV